MRYARSRFPIYVRMTAYTVSFLAFILGAVPYGFHQLGRLLAPDPLHAWLQPGIPQHILGVVIFVVGLAGYLICSLWLVIVGKGPFVEFDPPKEFVATGPYRWMRNPVAAMLIVTVLGEAVFFGSAGIFALFVLGFPLAQLQVTRIEEPRLKARFGKTYVEYCRRVPRWIPKRPAHLNP
ncbi:MAG: isoprenylcysteine carboxylmethyltransferase family protein [Phycisphaerae bacterium]|nr:isoprenylcysteine carboxylmethyltransferase family protein [Phycisphaerae bacterium]